MSQRTPSVPLAAASDTGSLSDSIAYFFPVEYGVFFQLFIVFLHPYFEIVFCPPSIIPFSGRTKDTIEQRVKNLHAIVFAFNKKVSVF